MFSETTPACGNCKFGVSCFHRDEQQQKDFPLRCHIRSTSPDFPSRDYMDWCGEFAAKEIEEDFSGKTTDSHRYCFRCSLTLPNHESWCPETHTE